VRDSIVLRHAHALPMQVPFLRALAPLLFARLPTPRLYPAVISLFVCSPPMTPTVPQHQGSPSRKVSAFFNVPPELSPIPLGWCTLLRTFSPKMTPLGWLGPLNEREMSFLPSGAGCPCVVIFLPTFFFSLSWTQRSPSHGRLPFVPFVQSRSSLRTCFGTLHPSPLAFHKCATFGCLNFGSLNRLFLPPCYSVVFLGVIFSPTSPLIRITVWWIRHSIFQPAR